MKEKKHILWSAGNWNLVKKDEGAAPGHSDKMEKYYLDPDLQNVQTK